MRRARKILAFVAILCLTETAAFAALPAYMKITGQLQGDILGDVTTRGREGSIEVFQLQHEVVSPRDPATGQATGRRQHKPLTFRMEIDKSTPHLYKALVTNEMLTTVEIKFFAPDPAGKEINNFTIKLTNAYISSIQSVLPDTKNASTSKYPMYLDIAFTYQKIEWTWTDGGITAQDYWDSPAV